MLQFAHIADFVASDMDAAAIVAELGTEVDLTPNTTAYTWSGVYEQLALAGVSFPLSGLEDKLLALPEGDVLVNSIRTGGFNFARTDFQAKCEALLPALSGESKQILEALKAIGQPVGPLWQKLGLESLPTTDQIASVITQHQAEQAAIDSANFSRNQLALSVNRRYDGRVTVSCRSVPVAIVAGVAVKGDAVGFDSSQQNLTPAQQQLIDSVLSAVTVYVEAVQNG